MRGPRALTRMRRWIPCCTLLLSACLMSETPEIPRSELVQPADLPGRYWMIPLQRPQDVEPVEFRRGPEGRMLAPFRNDPAWPADLRLVALAMPDLYLAIDAYDERRSSYRFLVRRELGAWDELEIESTGRGPFGRASLAHLQGLAARHGLGIEARGEDTMQLTGALRGGAVPGLFRDTEFVAALAVVPGLRYLPAPPAPSPQAPAFPAGSPSIPLELDQGELPGARWLRPEGLEGEHDTVAETPGGPRIATVRITPLPDGRFERSEPGRIERFGVLPLDAEAGQFLWVSFDCRRGLSPAAPCLLLSVLRRDAHGWTIERVLRRGTETIAGRVDLLAPPMNAAALRQGVRLEGSRLQGGITAAGLAALLADGQFTTGLALDRSRTATFSRRAPGRQP